MLEAVELPAGIADLDTGLADVDRDALSHISKMSFRKIRRVSEENAGAAFIKTPLR